MNYKKIIDETKVSIPDEAKIWKHKVFEWPEVDENNPAKMVDLYFLNSKEITLTISKGSWDFILYYLKNLLKIKASLFLITHLDHDEYFVIEVHDSDSDLEIRILAYTEGNLNTGFSVNHFSDDNFLETYKILIDNIRVVRL